jgi:iron(III) transport system ATP-binding protein
MNPEEQDNTCLIVESVSHSFGTMEVVRDASLEIAAGEIHCVLGPSGSGKTTLLRLIAGLERLQTGRIELFGSTVANSETSLPAEQRSIGFVFQDYALFPHLNVLKNVLFGMTKQPDRSARAKGLLADVGMQDFQNAMPHTLSGGQQQRVALARALARDPKIVLLDEPFSGLDTQLRDEVRRSTMRVLKSANIATVMVTHDPQEAMLIADRISVISEGRIIQTGTPVELYSKPHDINVAKSLGEVNLFDAQIDNDKLTCSLGTFQSATGDRTVTMMVRPEHIHI